MVTENQSHEFGFSIELHFNCTITFIRGKN